MEFFISALMGELISRSVSCIISKYSKPPAEVVEAGLERILLRGQVIIDEAIGRHITNHGMLRQLSMLRYAMFQGYYVLDTFRYQAYKEEDENNQAVSQSGVMSQRLCLFSSNSKKTSQRLEEALEGLKSLILDAREMVRFLTTYPRLHRQPYSMHLLVGKCMFARQRETEVVINFLLCTQSCTSRFDVLPIVGPESVGKSTLVTHICEDERVRDCFPQIIIFRHDSFRAEDIAALRGKCAARNEKTGRLLIIVDVVGDLDEDMWEILWSLCRQSTTSGSKIIITSRADKITKLGTTQTLVLKHLSHEAFWYFFKVVTFGSTDPKMHPRLVCLAMEIAESLNDNLVDANMTASVLRANFNINFWCKVLAFRRGYIQNQLCKFGEHPHELLSENRLVYLQRMGRTTEDVLVLGTNQTCSSEEEVPKITALDVWYGTTRPQGTFKVLAWKSRIPPYHSYIQTYEIRELQARAVKRKRPLMNGIRRV